MTREAEVRKYEKCYLDPAYRMGAARRRHIIETLDRFERGSLLDVGTGRGETMAFAEGLGYDPVRGTEAVDYLCDGKRVIQALGHDLPFGDRSFDYVTMFDVMEHLVPDDTGAVCRELARVASKAVLLTVCNSPDVRAEGDLHINLRASYNDWHGELEHHFGRPVEFKLEPERISQLFTIPIA